MITEPNFYFRIPYFHQIDRFTIPEWVKETVWYQIFPERFANGDKANDPEHTLPWEVKIQTEKTFSGRFARCDGSFGLLDGPWHQWHLFLSHI